MCGIAGFLGAPRSGDPAAVLGAMTACIAHRGPDADGHWLEPESAIGLGHRRLSILDLSPLGAQPMTSASGRFVMVFNGEIYNFAVLRDELATLGHTFRGHSDTEILLAAAEQWGVREAVTRSAGMFAIAIWDRRDRRLSLARDRLGEKPLYLGRIGDTWAFGSELKSLRAVPGFDATLDPAAIAQLLRHGYIQAPRTIHRAVRKVRPGTILELRAGHEPDEHVYWSAHEAARRGLADPFRGSMDDVVDALDAVLRPVVRDEMVSDVPLGAFLSGGIDSSLVVSLMQAQSTRPVKTYTIGMDDPRYDESPHATAVATHLGTDHTVLPVRGDDALEFVERLPDLYDEPMADSSQLPTLLVSRLTRRHVTVALSGDGGDELFGGYTHHRQLGTIAALRARIPAPLRAPLGAMLARVPDPAPDALVRMLSDGGTTIGARPANALTRLGDMLAAGDEQGVFRAAIAHSTRPSRLLRPELRAAAGDGAQQGPWLAGGSAFEARMLFDAIAYLPDDIMVKVDRAAMAFSLETRAPILDHRVFEFAWRVPYAQKVIDGTGKQPLRRLLHRYVPRELVERPKQGFSIPLPAWLRGPLRPWAEELLSAEALRTGGVFAEAPVRRLWTQHAQGVADHAERLWAILTLQASIRSWTRR